MLKPIKQIPVFFLITVIFSIMAYWVIHNNDSKISQQEKAIIKRSRSNYQAIVDGYGTATSMFFEHVINQTGPVSLLKKAQKSYGAQRHQYRKSLYELMLNKYEKLEKEGFYQLQFHFPNSVSFLRFDNPRQYGDNLKPNRFSVKRTNELKAPTFGMEEGHYSVGYRYVFPIVQSKEHIGSAGLSVSFEAFNKKISKLNKSLTLFIIQKNAVDQSILNSKTSSYKVCPVIKSYVFDTLQNSYEQNKNTTAFFKSIVQKHTESFRQALHRNYTNIFNVKYQQKHYSIVSIPVPNIQGNQLGNYLMAYPNKYIATLQDELSIRLSIIILSYLLLVGALIIIIRREKQLIASGEKIQASQTRLLETDETKNKLFEIITHDLRNHFNAVNGFIDLYEKQGCEHSEKNQKLFQGLSDAVYLTNSLMNNLFMWSRIQTGRIDCNNELFEASKWFARQLQKFESISKRKNIVINNQTKPPVYIQGDVDLLTVIVRNIVHNAIKFSLKKSRITTWMEDTVKDTIIIVKDEGRGMTPSEVDNLLSRESWAGARSETDIGLGLFVSRKLIDYHQGTIDIDSAKEIGTTVRITIPKSKSEQF